MNRLKLLLLYLIGFFVYTQGYWERFTPIPVATIIELLVWVLAIFYFRPKHKASKIIFALIIVNGLFTGVATSTSMEFIKYIRWLFYSYVIIDVFRQCNLTYKQFKHFFIFTIVLVLLQGLAAAYQIFILDLRIEGYVGMMSSLGGTTAAAFPMVIIGLIIVAFCYSSKFKAQWYLLMLTIICAMFLVGFSSGKRAIYYLFPLILIVSVISCYYVARLKHIQLGFKKIIVILLLSILCIPLYFEGIKNSRGYNYELRGTETRMEILQEMFDYTQDYETAESDGLTIGRSNSSSIILSNAIESPQLFFWGHGYSSIKDKHVVYRSGIEYGFVGFSRDLFSGGIFSCLLTIIFIITLFLYKDYNSQDAFSKSIRICAVASFLIIHLFYSSDFTISLKINFILAFILALTNSKSYIDIKERVSLYLRTENDNRTGFFETLSQIILQRNIKRNNDVR